MNGVTERLRFTVRYHLKNANVLANTLSRKTKNGELTFTFFSFLMHRLTIIDSKDRTLRSQFIVRVFKILLFF